ncbi:Ig-like domain-containing protein [Psychrobacter celer]|uniref:Ig-like domain-containing protein n=1 Tax=Psychrobacter celer TaxID=306572 RepID=UPI0018E059F7|nr:Ig-like domain-containing protein [Psychrobacter celer]
MSYSSLPLSSKLFQLTSLTCALALAGCGGGGDGDTVDSVAPAPDLGVQPGTGNENNNNGNGGSNNSGEQVPAEDFSLQKLYTVPTNIKLTDEPVIFNVTVKAVENISGGAAIDKAVSLSIDDSLNTGVTIEGSSTQTTDDKGVATYELKLNPLVLDETQKANLIKNGFSLKAAAKQPSNGATITQVLTVRVSKEGSGDGTQTVVSTLDVDNRLQTSSVSNNKLNPYGDRAQFSVILKNADGARVADVQVGMGVGDIKGVAIVGSNKTTDSNGVATFDIIVDKGLSKAAREALLKGVVYAINIIEKNGATKEVSGILPVAIPTSDYKLTVSGNASALNAYGDSQTITINAAAINDKVPTSIAGAKASIKLNSGIKGVSLSTEALTFDDKGQAVVDLIVAPTLSNAERTKLAKEGLSYTITLSEPNNSKTVKEGKSNVEIPAAKYQIKAANTSKARISSFGSSVDISFRVNDKDGGAVAGEKVTVSLPAELTAKGLLSLDSTAMQTTDNKGMVSYTVSIPKGLSKSNRAILEKAGGFVLSAKVIEASGASSKIDSAHIQITAESETILDAKSIPRAINVLKNSFSIQVAAKRPDGSAANDKEVKLSIENVPGVSIAGSKQITNNAGVANFTLNIQDLTDTQRNNLVKNGIPYTVTLTDDDGITSETYNASVIMPIAEYKINTGTASKSKLLSTGGETTISFRVNDKTGGIVAGQQVTASLPSILTQKGLVTLTSAANQTTDAQGVVNYTVRIPEGLSVDQRKAIERSGFSLVASLTESSGVSVKAKSEKITVNADPTRSDIVVSASTMPSVVNVLKDSFSIQVAAKLPNGNAAINKPVELSIEGIKGVSIAGNQQTTDGSGNATFIVNIDPSLSLAERRTIAASNIDYKVVLTDNDSRAIESFTAEADVPAAQYKISFGQMSSDKLSSSGGSTTISFRVNDKNGGVIANQVVKASLPAALVNAGVITLDGATNQTTDAKGMVSFNVRVPTNLNQAQKTLIENHSGFALNVAAVESTGATSTASVAISVTDKVQTSQTTLAVTTNPAPVNILKDSFSIQVSGVRNDGSAAADKVAKLTINNASKLTLQNSEQKTDAKGITTFTVNISPTMSDAERQALVKSGLSYTVSLTDIDGVVSSKYNAPVIIPAAQYQLSFGTLTNKQLSSSGGSTTISFRINDKNGGVIANQPVTASLPDNLVGLLSLDSSATKLTNNQGEVSFTVRVPAGLNSDQKAKIEKAKSFVLTAMTVEDSGAKSDVTSSLIALSDEVGQSEIQLVDNSNQPVLTTDKQFVVDITGKYPDSSAAFNRVVKLKIDQPELFTIIDAEQSTDNAGRVSFTVNIKDNLNEDEQKALAESNINYTATIIDVDGTQATLSGKIQVEKPTTTLSFASIITPSISEFGGEGIIKVKLLSNKSSSAAQNQDVNILLGKKAQDYGVTVSSDSSTTDFNGETTFIVTIPEGLNYEKREELKKVGINYQLSYIEKGETYTSAIKNVIINTPTVDLTVLNNPTLINNRPYYTLNGEGDTVVVGAGISTQTTNIPISGQPVTIDFKDRALAKLLTVNGKAGDSITSVTTDASGNVSFTVTVPNNLTKEQKAALKNKTLEAVLRETLTGKTQAIEFNVQSTKAAIDLIDLTPTPLNLNGGETQVEVIAKDSQDNVIAGQKVFLALPAAIAEQGVRLVSGKEQVTNNSGVASYTLAVPAGLTEEQKKAIGSSFFVAFSAADANGNIATQTSTVTTTTPSSATGTTESIAIGANKVVSTKGDTFKVFVRATDNDNAIGNREVRLSVDNPIQTGVSIVGSSTASTNSDGVATFDLKLEPGANVNQAILEAGIKVTATTKTTGGFDIESDYIVPVDTATIDEYQILVSSDKSTLTTGGDQTNATFRVTDSKGGILAGVPVQLAITNLAASGAALTTPSMVTTDANGQIDVGVLLAAGSINARLNHTIDIEAKIVTPEYDANGVVTLTTRESKILSLSAVGTKISIEASNTKLQDGETITITTILVDGAGQTIGNTAMQLVNANGDLITPAAIATTNSDGQATFEVKEDQLTFDSNGNLQVFARAVGEDSINTQRSLNSIDLVKVSQAGISFINIEKLYDVNEPQEIQIQIRADNANQANSLIGKQVELQTSLGSLITSYISKFNGEVVVSKPIKPSDIQGNVITVKFWLKSELAGTAVLQATVLGETLQNGEPRYQTTVDTRFRATTPAKMLFQAVKSVITPGTSTEVVATVKDENDVPVEGQTVVFSRASDSSTGRLSAATAVTDSRGEARVVYQANASSPIGGVIINARLLQDDANIGSKTTNITVSEEAVYTTLAFANKLSSDDIYYTVRGSISVMDGSGRAVPNQEVSIKSYATQYAQGRVCLLDSTVTYQAADIKEKDENGKEVTTTPEPKVFSEKSPIFLQSEWITTEDLNYNYTLDQDEDIDKNVDANGNIVIGNKQLDPINPVAIIGGTVSEDGYTFITDDEGRADFQIRYPLRYSKWVKVRFDASTFVNGSENTQSINYQLPSEVNDLSIVGDSLLTPWINNESPFGAGGATCVNSMSVKIDENAPSTSVEILTSPLERRTEYTVSIGGQSNIDSGINHPFYSVSFNEALLGSIVTVSNSNAKFSRVLKVE